MAAFATLDMTTQTQQKKVRNLLMQFKKMLNGLDTTGMKFTTQPTISKRTMNMLFNLLKMEKHMFAIFRQKNFQKHVEL